MWLTRDQFRHEVFERDGHKCVVCGADAADAHHILERKLFGDCGGYALDNGASLCAEHHLMAEQTTLSCEEIREFAGIKKIVLPEHFYSDQRYDKWGNIILHSGLRLKGELFYDPSVQKILKEGNVLNQFCKYIKYPRTYHLPFSSQITHDDRVMKDTSCFDQKRVIVTEKMDGENSTLYPDKMHARSIDGMDHASRNWLKGFHAQMKHNIPEGWRICGENVYAKHTIYYDSLSTYFYLFSIWDEMNHCLSWDETVEWANLLDLETVKVLYDGLWDEAIVKELCKDESREGFVVRLAEGFCYMDFRKSVGKWVNPKFKIKLQNEDTFHWRYRPFTINKLRKEENSS